MAGPGESGKQSWDKPSPALWELIHGDTGKGEAVTGWQAARWSGKWLVFWGQNTNPGSTTHCLNHPEQTNQLDDISVSSNGGRDNIYQEGLW